MDGFDTGDYAQRWMTVAENATLPAVINLVSGRFGYGQAVSLEGAHSNFTGGLAKSFLSATATIRFGMAVKLTEAPSEEFAFILIPGFAGSYANMFIKVTTAGGLVAVRHSSNNSMWTINVGTTILAAASEGLPLNQWAYLEVEYLPASNPTGRIIIRKNGTIILDYTGDTRSTTSVTKPDMIVISPGYSPAPTIVIDDFYLTDTSGSYNNTFKGDVEVRALAPNGNGTYSQFTGSDGNSVDNYDLINDTTYTDYVESSTVGNKDSYQLEDVSGVNIHAAQSVVRGAQTSGGMAAVRPFVRVGSTDYPGGTQYLGQQNVSTHIYEVNPATSAAWTAGDINNTEVGVEVV
jgi:hypothetical protein